MEGDAMTRPYSAEGSRWLTAEIRVRYPHGDILALCDEVDRLRATLDRVRALRPVAWAKHNGAGEFIFRQAGHPANETDLHAQGWRPLFVRAIDGPDADA